MDRKKPAGIRIAASGIKSCDRFPPLREIRLVHITEANQREHEEDTGMGVSGAPEVLPQRIRHVSRISSQHHEESHSAVIAPPILVEIRDYTL
jgi:hypothetical protein